MLRCPASGGPQGARRMIATREDRNSDGHVSFRKQNKEAWQGL